MACSTPALGFIHLKGVLADRPVSKLYEVMGNLDSSVAAAFSADNFDRELGTFQEKWLNDPFVPIRYNHAVDSHLFLCAAFCSSETVNAKIESWKKWHSENKRDEAQTIESSAGPNRMPHHKLARSAFCRYIVKGW